LSDLYSPSDSVPAIFRHHHGPVHRLPTQHLRILGLRALYFALAAMIHRFKY